MKRTTKAKESKKAGRPKIAAKERRTDFKTLRVPLEISKALDRNGGIKSETVLSAIEAFHQKIANPKGGLRCPFCKGSGFELSAADDQLKRSVISYRASPKVYAILDKEKNQSEYTTLALYSYFMEKGKLAGKKCPVCKGKASISKFTVE